MIQGLKWGMERGRAKTCPSGARTTGEPGAVCVYVHTREGTYRATQRLARHKAYSSACEQTRDAKPKLHLKSVGVLSS